MGLFIVAATFVFTISRALSLNRISRSQSFPCKCCSPKFLIWFCCNPSLDFFPVSTFWPLITHTTWNPGEEREWHSVISSTWSLSIARYLCIINQHLKQSVHDFAQDLYKLRSSLHGSSVRSYSSPLLEM